MPATLVLTGDAKLNRRLKNLATKLQKQFVRKAARFALKPVLQAARDLAPTRTGNLRKSIKIRALKRSRSRIGMRVTTGLDAGSYFTGKAFYGAFVELGWKTGKRGSSNRKSITGRNFLRRAAKNKQRIAISRYRTKLRELITAEATKG